jgi:ABC-type multidrug transport system fused ATPase/permease subunit
VGTQQAWAAGVESVVIVATSKLFERHSSMRRSTMALPTPAAGPAPARSDWATLRKLLPYLWRYRWRVGIALAFLVAAKVANVGVPVLLKELVDGLSIKPGDTARAAGGAGRAAVAYGALRLSTSLFTELRELIFAKATEGTARSISLQVFRHLHALSPALPPRAPDRRHDARHRTRHARRAFADLVLALQHPAHADRGHAWC